MGIGSNGPGEETRAMREDLRMAGQRARESAQREWSSGQAEIEQLIDDVQALIARIGQPADPAIAHLSNRVTDAIGAAQQALGARGAQLQRQARDALEAGDNYVRARPWQVIGAVAAVSVLLGLLLPRR